VKVFFDTCVLNWMVDNPRGRELRNAITAGRIALVLTPEVSQEIHDTTNSERLETLLTELRPLLPVSPTRVPMARRDIDPKTGRTTKGLARAGVMLAALRRTDVLEKRLGLEIVTPAELLVRLGL
jgi:hypothetical protein